MKSDLGNLWNDGIKRGDMMLEALEKEADIVSGKTILDLGCGYGGISIAFKKKAHSVYSVDIDADRLTVLSNRIQSDNISGIFLVKAECVKLPFCDNTFDIVVFNGVLEWVGYEKVADPRSLQRIALSEIFRVLKSGGILYLATENRFYPVNFFKDPHTRVPFVAFLPFSFSNFISKVLTKKPYQTPIYSYRGIKQLIEFSGFSKLSIFSALLSYQYPSVLKKIDGKTRVSLKKDEIEKISYEYNNLGLAKFVFLKLLFCRLVFFLNLQRLFSHNFIVLAQK